MTKQTKDFIMMWIGVLSIFVSTYMHLVLKVNLLISMSILVFYSLSLTGRNLTRKMEDIEAKKNLMVFIFLMAVLFISLYGCMMESYFGGLGDLSYLSISIMVAILSLINSVILFKHPSANYYKTIACISTVALCFTVTLSIETFWALFAAIPLMSVFTIYNDTKLRFILCFCINILNIICCIRQLTIVHKWDEYHVLWYLLEIFAVIIFTSSFNNTSKIITKINKHDLSLVEQKKQTTLELSKETVEIGKDIEKNVNDTMQLIDDIDLATENSLLEFKEIVNDNIGNAKSVEEQSKMTSSINHMIYNVLNVAKTAEDSTIHANETVLKNKASFANIKNMSNNIVENNISLINVFDNFQTNLVRLKDIIKGISEIAEQINLLSINASIESVKSKENTKDFAVVAISIKALSAQTAALTNEIDTMVSILDKHTHNAVNAVLDVVEEINKENETIDNTMNEFENIETYINNLKNSVSSIISKVNNVVNFSNVIESHITQLAAMSEEFAACTEEGVNINKNNRLKAAETNALMKDVLNVVNELEKYTFS